MGFFRDFFGEHKPTVDDAFRKAEQVGWSIEESKYGYTVFGENMDGQPDRWDYASREVEEMNSLLDHANSVAIGEEYRLAKWGEEWDDPTGDKKQEIREYRTTTYYDEEYKPGWKRWLGL